MDRKKLEELNAIQEELLRRREDDPLTRFKPTDKQQPFVDAVLKEKVRNAWFIGANRSGKSQIGAYVGSHLARFGKEPKSSYSKVDGTTIEVKDRSTSGWVVSLDFPNSRDVAQPKYFDNGYVPGGGFPPFIPEREVADWNKTDQVLKLKNGSIVGFKSADSSEKKFQGTGKDWIHFDEEPPRPIYEESVIRVEAGRSLTIFGTCTLLPPIGEAGGVSWIFDKFINPWKSGELKDIKLFGASIYDNPYIGRDEIRMLESLFPEGTPGRRIRLEGEWLPGIGGARTYPSFERTVHVKELGPLNPNLPIAFIWDFNVSPMVCLVGQRSKVFRVHRELVMEDDANIQDMVAIFSDLYPDISQVTIYGDATGTHRTHHSNEQNTDYKMILNELRTHGYNCKLKVPNKNPRVMDRVNSVNRALKNELGEFSVEIDSSCKELIDDLEQVLMDPRGGIKKSHNRKDPYYRRTHSCLRGETLIKTTRGEIPIKFIKNGDEVILPEGKGRVINSGPVKKVDKLFKLELSNNETIWATSEHKFLTERGLVTCDELRYHDTLITGDHPCVKTALSLMEENTTIGLRKAITISVDKELTEKTNHSIYIEKNGNSITGKFLKDFTSIISTKIKQITDWKISTVFQGVSIYQTIPKIQIGSNLVMQKESLMKTDTKQQSGMEVRKEENGTQNTQKRSGKAENIIKKHVKNAVRNISRLFRKDQNSAIRIVNKSLENVESEYVYDLTVEKHHCYQVGSVLVSNSDALGYWIVRESPIKSVFFNSGISVIKDVGYNFVQEM